MQPTPQSPRPGPPHQNVHPNRQVPLDQRGQQRPGHNGSAMPPPGAQPGGRRRSGSDQRRKPSLNAQPRGNRQPAPGPPAQWDEKGKPSSKDKRRGRALAREERWQNNRLAVPYRTDGPKITFGIIWFALIVGAALLGVSTGDPAVGSLGIAVVGAPIAALAALQTAHAWFPKLSAPRLWMASTAYLIGIGGFFEAPGVIIGFAFGVLVVSLYVLLYRGHQRPPLQLFDILARSAIPAGLVIACMAAIAKSDVSALVSLILLISAYEAGDFLVGTGSANAIEGPMAGIVALGTVAFLLFLTLPPPFTESTVLLFALLTAICCPLGQVLASGLLPRGAAWAPALRRIDSYLIAAPLWLVLLNQVQVVG